MQHHRSDSCVYILSQSVWQLKQDERKTGKKKKHLNELEEQGNIN